MKNLYTGSWLDHRAVGPQLQSGLLLRAQREAVVETTCGLSVVRNCVFKMCIVGEGWFNEVLWLEVKNKKIWKKT